MGTWVPIPFCVVGHSDLDWVVRPARRFTPGSVWRVKRASPLPGSTEPGAKRRAGLEPAHVVAPGSARFMTQCVIPEARSLRLSDARNEVACTTFNIATSL